MPVAEEINAQFDCKDVPMENASQSDLDLINISIDDEEHEEDGEDWSSKMGLNLRYCVKLRKQSSSKQEQLTLALGGIFSGRDPLSVVSGLKWISQKSRTHHRTTTPVRSRLKDGIGLKKDELTVRNSYVDPSANVQVNEICIGEMAQHSKRRGRPRKEPSKELGSRNEASIADDKRYTVDHRCKTRIDEELMTNSPIPAPASENAQTHQESLNLGNKEINTSSEVWDFAKTEDSPRCALPVVENCKSQLEIQAEDFTIAVGEASDSVKSTDHQLLTAISVFDDSKIQENIHCEKESSTTKCEVCCSVESSGQLSIGSLTVENFKLQQDIKSDIEGKDVKALRLGTEPTASVSIVDGSEVLQDILITTSTEDMFNSGLLVGQPTTSVSMVDGSEMHQEIAAAEDITTEGKVGTSNAGQPTTRVLTVDSSEIHDIQTEEQTDKGELEAQSTISSSLFNCFKMQQNKGIAEDTNIRAELLNSAKSASSTCVSEKHQIVQAAEEEKASTCNVIPLQNVADKDNRLPHTVQLKLYERRRKKIQREVDQREDDLNPPERPRNKRKREVDQIKDVQFSGNEFVHSPCEGLRPRSGRSMSDGAGNRKVQVSENVMKGHRRGREGSVGHKNKGKVSGPYRCDLEGCHMSFRTRGELSLHKRNRCTYEGCEKRFSSHKYVLRHQCVHTDERPLKCPWKGCSMSFKWAWARTEHVRVHTGERPYKCKVTGCCLTFRFISDFSRHRRKTGHSVN